jgi:hypothetical protein
MKSFLISKSWILIQNHECFDSFYIYVGDISISCRKAERYFCTQCRVVQFIWMCSLLLPFPRKTFIIFPDPVLAASDNRRLDANWYPIESSHEHYRDIYIICRRTREAIRRALNSKTQLEITGEMYQMPPRRCVARTCALFDSHHARDIVSRKLLRSADIGHQDAMRMCILSIQH